MSAPKVVEIDGVRYVPAGSDPAKTKPANVRESRQVSALLLKMLWLYPNYEVGSRGPVGIVHDALRWLAPGAQEMLAEGMKPDDVAKACFPEEWGDR